MLYIVRSNTKSIKDKIIEELLKGNEISNDDIYVFDYEELKSPEPALLEYLTLDFDKKVKAIILKNADFINLKSVDKNMENRFVSSMLLKNNNLLILTVDKLNKTGMIRKKLEGNSTVIEKDAPSKNEMFSFIKGFFENRNINIQRSEIDLIISRSSDDFDLLISELTKLDILQTKGEITRELIEKGTLDFSRERLYKIVEYVATLNVEKIMDMMNQYREEGESPYLIGEFMVKDFSKLLVYKSMREEGYADNQIKDITNWNPWAIRNYSNWIWNWKDIQVLKEFFYDVILQSCFFDMLNNQPEQPIDMLEKILVANVMDIKSRG